MTGQVVPELGALTALQTLSLRDNQLSNVIPPEIGQLTALKHLFLSNNKLTGQSSLAASSGGECAFLL